MSEAAKFWAEAEGLAAGPYVERADGTSNWFDRTATAVLGGLRSRLTPRRIWAPGLPAAVAAEGEGLAALSDRELGLRATALRPALLRDGFTRSHVAAAFALVAEASGRVLGIRHRPVQLYGGHLLLRGALLEMATGEGKTVTAMLAAATAALAGQPVHVITVNDYLARRDCEELGPVYRILGISTGLVAAGMEPAERRTAYGREVVYVNNKEITFDYLRDRMTLGPRRSAGRARVREAFGDPQSPAVGGALILRGLHFGIVDEADSVLIDEARTPLIISSEAGRAEDPTDYRIALDIARKLDRGRDFDLIETERAPRLLAGAAERIREFVGPLGGLWGVARAREERIVQALSALHLFERDRHYIVAGEKVQIVDEYTGRVMEDRSWEAGLHQMIEAKEGVPLSGRRTTIARITYQRFFARYRRLSGMTGTGTEVAGELLAGFGLRTVKVPTHRPVRRRQLGTRLHRTAPEKWAAVVARTAALVRPEPAADQTGRPVLIGVRSVEDSEHVSGLLGAAGIAHVVLNARQDAEEAAIVAKAGQAGAVTVATNMAGRGTDIRLGAGVVEAGGLHVILTAFHESPRIDRQLFGRAGRQGDPGSAEAIVALDDDLFARFPGRLAAILGRWPGGRPLPGAPARLLRRIAQDRAERLFRALRRGHAESEDKLRRALGYSGTAE